MPALAQPLASSGESGENLEISVLTFGPGEIYWERFGHNAILVRDRLRGTAVAYNYGIFDFNQKNFFLNFARGYMQYRMAADPLERDLDLYQYEGRWVQEQKLNLTPAQRAALNDFLHWNALPENRNYRYDYFRSNCSTKVRDALDQVLGGSLRRQLQAQATPYSYRYDAVRLVSPDFWAGIGMDVALGPTADIPQNGLQESFVPMVLMQQLRTLKITDAEGHEQPLVSEDTRILEAQIPDDPKQPPDWRLPFLLIGLAAAGLLVLLHTLRARRAARTGFAVLATSYALLCGVCGLILLAIWFLTQHWAGWHNQNLLLLNPLCLLLLPAWIGSGRVGWKSRPWVLRLAWIVTGLAAFSLLLRLIPGCYQGNLPWILLLLPPHLALLYSARRAQA
ncbi:MAG: DUF4105 domain-containing protein [Nevskia sp.]|nr:DUF4105 domain-containing protein [Nevskia sp.]